MHKISIAFVLKFLRKLKENKVFKNKKALTD
jgi:hypothetical protein